MKKSDFNFELPKKLIAQYPATERCASRLLVLQQQSIQHRGFCDFIDLINPGDLLVFNNTKVIPARIFGVKQTGGKVEILLERIIDENTFMAHIRASKAPKSGAYLILERNIKVKVVERKDDLFVLHNLMPDSIIELLEQHGHMPLPPYIERNDIGMDKERYQTVYAQHKGAVAAPTAGLHFDQPMLDALREKGVNFAFVTLHIGAGTFQPVRVDDIKTHKMHTEWIDVPAAVCEQIEQTHAANKQVIAIGTTSVRCLETASQTGKIKPYRGDTDIFIYPGYQFHCVDALLTNFHLPESTLLMLVTAFAGYDTIMQAYQIAVEEEYRFFSYGDAMLITRA